MSDLSDIYKLVPGAEPEVVREESGRANGLTFDLQGAGPRRPAPGYAAHAGAGNDQRPEPGR